MPEAVFVKIIIVSTFTIDVIDGSEKYQFFLDIRDMFDSAWMQSEYRGVGTTVQCASLCYQHGNECAYFGYKGDTCYLLKDTVDRIFCSKDDCTDSGMKVYKWTVEESTTTTTKVYTTADTTSTLRTTTSAVLETTSTSTTTAAATTTEVTSTTTPAKICTTSTEEPTITTFTSKLTTTSTTTPFITTTEPDTTMTTKTSTTITDSDTATKTTEPDTTTTTTEAGITTTTELDLTTTSTEAGTTTTTDLTTTSTEVITTTTTTKRDTTTTTAITTTTTEKPTTTTQGIWTCPEPPDGAEAELKCGTNDNLLREMGSRSPFFGDYLAASCTLMNEQVYVDEADPYTFLSLDGGITLNSKCPHEHHVIVSFKLCISNKYIMGVTLNCHLLKDPDRIMERFNKSSSDEDGIHQLVTCGKYGAIQGIDFVESGMDPKPITRVDFGCVKIRVDDSVEDVAPEPNAGV